MAARSSAAPSRGLTLGACAFTLGAALAGYSQAAVVAPVVAPVVAALPVAPLADLRGTAAVQALGSRLAEVAARYRMSPQKLANLLRNDATARLDRNNRLYFVEATPATALLAALQPAPATPAPGPVPPSVLGNTPATTAYDPATTFRLHSHPGSNRTILLDFDGTELTNTTFDYNYPNPTTAPAVTLDDDPTTFNDAERQLIFRIWQRVAEDFAPFGVDVTTEEVGNGAVSRDDEADPTYGVRVVITHSSICGTGCNGIGGMAFLGGFDELPQSPGLPPGYYKPAMVFYDPYVQRPDAIAETISHEAGHTAGLMHDGNSRWEYQGVLTPTGLAVATSWAPIMGISDGAGISQWSKGDYVDASNQEDDFSIMAAHGLTPVEDDASDTLDLPTLLPGSAAGDRVAADRTGVIGSAADVDVYVFAAGAGPYTLDISTAAPGANLDLEARLYDAAGKLVALDNPPDATGARLSGTLAAGTYRLRLDGVGARDASTGYSDYGSVGQYRIRGQWIDSGYAAPVPRITARPATGTAPLLVSFDGRGSSDADGNVVAWSWDFGDGSTANGANPLHLYLEAGIFPATLTVKDNQGLTASLTTPVRVEAGLLRRVWIGSIDVSFTMTPVPEFQCTAAVKIVDALGDPVANAMVSGDWSETVQGSVSGRTDASGVVRLVSPVHTAVGTCVWTVSRVGGLGYVYAPARNVESSDYVGY